MNCFLLYQQNVKQFEYQQQQKQQHTLGKFLNIRRQIGKKIITLANTIAAQKRKKNDYKIQQESRHEHFNSVQQQCLSNYALVILIYLINIIIKTLARVTVSAAVSNLHMKRMNKFNLLLVLLLLLFMSCNFCHFCMAIESSDTNNYNKNNNENDINNNNNNNSQNDYDYTSNEMTPATLRGAANDSIQSAGIDAATTDDNDDDKLPSEVQKAVCTVTAGEVRASAEAVTTKTLKGVCGSAEMNLALSNLEAKLYKELQEIKLLLQQVAQNAGCRDTQTTSSSTEPVTAAINNKIVAAPVIKFQPIESNKSEKKLATVAATEDGEPYKTVAMPQLKSLPSQQHGKHWRDQEVSKFNNTMLSDRDFKVFTYYWKIENFTERIESGISATVESPIFSIKGKALRIKAHFQHLHRDFLYLQLEYASLKSGNRNNIILDMGGLFKEITNEKIHFKHKISILDQNNKQRTNDLASQEFFNLDNGFVIPNSALLASPYIKDNALLVQIFLYL